MSLEAQEQGMDTEQEMQELIWAIQRSTKEEQQRQALQAGLAKPSDFIYPPERREQMKAMRFLVSTLNQDTKTVQALAQAIEHMEARQRQIDEAKEEEERQALEKLREERRKAAEEARKDRGKGPLKSPSPTPQSPPRNIPSPHRSPPREDTQPQDQGTETPMTEQTTTGHPTTTGGSSSAKDIEEIMALRAELERVKKEKDQEREDHKATKELCERYHNQWKEAVKEVKASDSLIKDLTNIGYETYEVEDGETLKRGMRHLMKKHKELDVQHREMSKRYEDLLMKDVENVYRYENTRLQKTLEVVHEKCLKTEEAYQEAMKLYQTARSHPRDSAQAAQEETERLQNKIKELEALNQELSERASRAGSGTTTTGQIGSSSVPWARTSVDLHWNEEGELDDMSNDELPYVKADWKFQKEHFKGMSLEARRLSHYEAVVRKLGRHLFPDEIEKTDMHELSAPLIKMKTKAAWEDWEASHPEMFRAGYLADPRHLRSEAIMKDQLKWRLEWFKAHPETIKIYAESPQELRIDPSYCPWERRYSWDEYARAVEQQPFLLNWPKIRGPEKEDPLTERWMAAQCKFYIKLFERVPDSTCQIFIKILRMLYVCLTGFEDAKLIDRQFWKFMMGTRELAWEFEIGPTPQQVHGLWARVRTLPSHFIQTFKEMMQYGFIEGWTSSCFASTATPSARLIAHQLEDVQMPLTRGPLSFEETQRAFQLQEALEEVRPTHPLQATQPIPQGLVQGMENMVRMMRRAGLLKTEEESQPRVRLGKKTSEPKERGESSSKRRRKK